MNQLRRNRVRRRIVLPEVQIVDLSALAILERVDEIAIRDVIVVVVGPGPAHGQYGIHDRRNAVDAGGSGSFRDESSQCGLQRGLGIAKQIVRAAQPRRQISPLRRMLWRWEGASRNEWAGT